MERSWAFGFNERLSRIVGREMEKAREMEDVEY